MFLDIIMWICVFIIIFCIWAHFASKNKTITVIEPFFKATVKETKCTCKACGNIWFFKPKGALQALADGCNKAGNDMIRLGSGGTAWLIPDENKLKKDFENNCPKCNSSAIVREQVTHEL